MVDKNKEVTQLAERIDSQSAVALTDKQKLSLYKKSQKSGYPIDILEEVYSRGIESWTEETNKTPEQYAFGRVNSFIAGGKAMELDEDLLNESTEALKKKSASSGISTAILRQVYKRGVAAWRTGHRPGTTPQQWGMARVNSFITGGKTRRTADKDLWAKHKGKAVKEEFELEEMADKYKTGDAKTDAKRKVHFEKGKKMDDNNPEAYRDAPGDADARSRGMPESQYTKKYREMYNEQATGPLVLTNPVTPGQPQPLMLSPGARVDNARSPFTRSLPRSVPGSSVVLPDVNSTIQSTTTGATRAAPTSSVSNSQLQAALERGRRAMNINIAQPRASLASRFLSAAGKFAGRAALPIALVNPDDLGDGTFSGNTGIDASTPQGYFEREAEIRRQQQAGLAAWDNPATTTPETRTTSGGRNRRRIKEEVANRNENFAENKIKYSSPNFEYEWKEAERYPEFRKIGKDAWIELAKKGKAVTIKSAKGINNTDAVDPDSFSSLNKTKQSRALDQLKSGTVEMPIISVYSDGWKELVGGNTRLTAMLAQNKKAKVWVFKVPDEVAELAEAISKNPNDPASRFMGSDELVAIYKEQTPGQSATCKAVKDVVKEELESRALNEKAVSIEQQRLMGAAYAYKTGKSDSASPEVKKIADSMSVEELKKFASTKHKGLSEKVDDESITETTYNGKTVKLNKPFRTPGGGKKFAVYVDVDGDGKAKIVRFGDPNMSIKKDQPNRKKSYCARSSGQGNLNNKGSANYWSRKMWDC